MPKVKLITANIVTIFFIALIAGNIFGYFTINNMKDIDGFSSLGQRFADYGDLNGSIRRGPIYPVFLGSIYKIFGNSRFNVIFFQSVILGLLGVGTFLISYENFQSNKRAFLTGACTVLHPICLWYVSRFWVEILFASTVVLMIWSANRALSTPTAFNLSIFGVFAGIASLCKAVVLLFPLFLGTLVFGLYMFGIKIFQYLNGKMLFKIIVIPTTFMLLIILPWTIRNHMVSGTWTLVSSNVGVEFFRGNVYAEQDSFLLQKTISEIWDIAMEKESQILSQSGIDQNDSNRQKDELFDSMMKKFIVDHPVEFFIKILKQMPAFWMRGETTQKSIFFIFTALITLIFFIKGFIKLRKTSVFAYIVVIAIIYFNLLYAAIIAWARYSMPIYPPMFIICFYGIISAQNNWSRVTIRKSDDLFCAAADLPQEVRLPKLAKSMATK